MMQTIWDFHSCISCADALTAAFAEYSGKVVQRRGKEKPSIRRQLAQLRDMIQDMAKALTRNKHREAER